MSNEIKEVLSNFLLYGGEPPDITKYGSGKPFGQWLIEIKNADLKYWSIHFRVEHGEKGRVPDCNRSKSQTKWDKLIWLSRVGQNPISAVIQVKSDDSLELNPLTAEAEEGYKSREFEYGPIPPLNRISPSETDRLWGMEDKPFEIQESIRTYKLTNSIGNEFFIDAAFANNCMVKYSIRGELINSTNWYQVGL